MVIRRPVRTPYTVARDYLLSFAFYARTVESSAAFLRDLDLLQVTIERLRDEEVGLMREAGCTWAEVGDALGVSPQAAHHRYRTVTK